MGLKQLVFNTSVSMSRTDRKITTTATTTTETIATHVAEDLNIEVPKTEHERRKVAIIELKDGSTKEIEFKEVRGSSGFVNLTCIDEDGEDKIIVFDLQNEVRTLNLVVR